MSAEPVFEPDRVVAALNAAGVEYVVVGGLAVGAHGVVRATRDVDIVPAPDRRNIDRLAGCLQSLGGEHPIEGPLTGASLVMPASFKVQTVVPLSQLHPAAGRRGPPRDRRRPPRLDWGGPIGLWWATRHPERVRGLFVLNTFAHRPPERVKLPLPLRLFRTPGVGEVMVTGSTLSSAGCSSGRES